MNKSEKEKMNEEMEINGITRVTVKLLDEYKRIPMSNYTPEEIKYTIGMYYTFKKNNDYPLEVDKSILLSACPNCYDIVHFDGRPSSKDELFYIH